MRFSLLALGFLAACSSGGTGGSSGSTNPACGEIDSEVSAAVASAQGGCSQDSDCVLEPIDLSCFSSCSTAVAAARADDVAQALSQIDARLCDAGRCPAEHSSCFNFGDPVCHDGLCGLGQGDSGLADPPGFGGYFHETGIGDALNLSFDPSGSYAAVLYGCDLQQAYGGNWFLESDGELSLVHGVATTMVANVDGGLLVTDSPLFFPDGGADLLAPGAVCAVCDGGGGPTALVPCARPFGF